MLRLGGGFGGGCFVVAQQGSLLMRAMQNCFSVDITV